MQDRVCKRKELHIGKKGVLALCLRNNLFMCKKKRTED